MDKITDVYACTLPTRITTPLLDRTTRFLARLLTITIITITNYTVYCECDD